MTEASVVICAHTLERWDELKRAVGSVRTQTRPPREIVVVGDNNQALRERAAQEIAGVTVLPNVKQPGLSGGRMTGAEHATAPVIAFLDDDAVADLRWLKERGWNAEMSAYVKTQDPNHLVASGTANPDLEDFDVSVHIIDFGTWLGYPVYWKVTPDELNKLISQYCAHEAISKKPVLLEEFGYASWNTDAVDVFTKWLRTLTEDRQCAGWLVWRLVSQQDDGFYPEDKEGFDVSRNLPPTWKVFKAATQQACKRNQQP